MNRIVFLGASASLAALAAAFATPSLRLDPASSAASTTRPTLAVRHHHANCKPSAPIRIELDAEDAVGGRARVDYVLTPVLDALDTDVTIVLPQGGELRQHARPALGAVARRTELAGSVLAQLPDLPGAELEIHAHITIPDPDSPDGVSTFTSVESVTWGDPVRTVDSVVPVRSGDVLTLDTPATRD